MAKEQYSIEMASKDNIKHFSIVEACIDTKGAVQ